MTCREGQELLQQHLDGEAPPGALERHLTGCPECEASAGAVRRLVRGVSLLGPPAPPWGLGERIAGRLVEEARGRRRARRRRLAGLCGLAAAAAMVLGVGLWVWRPGEGSPAVVDRGPDVTPPEARERPAPEPRPEPLRDSMAKAGGAFTEITNRAASDTADRTATLWSLVPRSALEAPPEAPAPPLQPIEEASAGVSSGLSPVTQSARRAVGLFLRDLPVGRANPDRKTS